MRETPAFRLVKLIIYEFPPLAKISPYCYNFLIIPNETEFFPVLKLCLSLQAHKNCIKLPSKINIYQISTIFFRDGYNKFENDPYAYHSDGGFGWSSGSKSSWEPSFTSWKHKPEVILFCICVLSL